MSSTKEKRMVKWIPWTHGKSSFQLNQLMKWNISWQKGFVEGLETKSTFEYLVKWKNQSFEDASWISEEELEHLQGYSSSTDSVITPT
jgi:hypothetical protein